MRAGRENLFFVSGLAVVVHFALQGIGVHVTGTHCAPHAGRFMTLHHHAVTAMLAAMTVVMRPDGVVNSD